jgi:hypothetical protein
MGRWKTLGSEIYINVSLEILEEINVNFLMG